MKKPYYLIRKSNRLTTCLMIVTLGFLSISVSAQTDINWTGAVDSDASNPLNWDPNNVGIIDNILHIDSAYKYVNPPILTLTGDNAINNFTLVRTAVFTVADAGNFFNVNTPSGGNTYINGGTLIVQAGNMSVRQNIYLRDSLGVIIIENTGWLETRATLVMANGSGSGPYYGGGSIQIKDDGKLHLRRAPIRFNSTDTTKSVITITGNGLMEVEGDWVAGAEGYIAKNQITSDDNNDAYAYFIAGNNLTVIDIRSKDELFLTSTATIQVNTGEILPDVTAVNNRGFQNLVSKEWKYATASGGPYSSFNPAQTGDALSGVSFADAGTYFVVLEGNTGSGTILSDEVQVSVTSPMVQVDPEGEQTIRVGWTGGMITATTLEAATSFEWKYSATSGGPYTAFDPAVTVNEYIPDFDAVGVYYVVCDAVVNGTTYTSPEVTIKMVARNAPGIGIDWTGAYSTDAADNRNWDPMTHPWFNTPRVSVDFVDNPPVIATAGNDTVQFFALADSAKIVINKPEKDTLTITSDGYQVGKIVIESGVVVNRQYGRLDHKNAGVVIKGNSQFLATGSGGFIIGNANAASDGGSVIIQDNGYMYAHHIWRWTNDTINNYIMISDNGKLELAGDVTSDVATWVLSRNQVRAPEGYVIQYVLRTTETDTFTVVTAKSEVAFDITPLTDQYVGVGLPIHELSTINDDNIVSREWKYSATSGSGYVSFDPAETGETLTASFDAAGTYYVVCEGSDGSTTATSDEVKINVISVEVTPADDQEILEFEEGTLLTVTESMVSKAKEWKYSTTSGSGYQSFAVAQVSDTYKPFFSTANTYYVVCESIYGDNNVPILSNEVVIVVKVDNTGIDESALPVEIYPNPNTGKFFINLQNGNAFTLTVFDQTGKVVLNEEFNNVTGAQEIMLHGKGMYILRMVSDDNVSTSKVVVE